jgi:hypothetical protein
LLRDYKHLRILLQPDIESKLGVTASGVVPPRDDVFECLQGLKPADIKVVVIGGRPAKSSNAASGYAFLDATARTVRSDRLPCAGNVSQMLAFRSNLSLFLFFFNKIHLVGRPIV